MVTAELAVGTGAVAVCLGIGLAAVSLGVDQVRCVDAAHVGARAAARGDPEPVVRGLVVGRAPRGSTVQVSLGSDARVEVRSLGRGVPGWLARSVPVGAVAVTPVENGVGGGG